MSSRFSTISYPKLFLPSVPPTKLSISDMNGKECITNSSHKICLVGPYLEGQLIELICEIRQMVKPVPKIYWFDDDGQIIDESFETIFIDSDHSKRYKYPSTRKHHSHFNNTENIFNERKKMLIRNRLKLNQTLVRGDFSRRFRCTATNTNLVKPIEVTVQLDMICKYEHSKFYLTKTPFLMLIII
ncbi:hypothetical protein QR98_0079400 [Sarcoptes scabiei]|uniref:Uncharacterized protein n=1 Tax=Sarcoptes scabiei TaxID=52283 RepID=A0A132AFR5_SARSC|nr:hypothetical protein QR98_0079400 [Sarcoptes scabiei]